MDSKLHWVQNWRRVGSTHFRIHVSFSAALKVFFPCQFRAASTHFWCHYCSAQKRYVTSLGTLVKEEMSRVKKLWSFRTPRGFFLLRAKRVILDSLCSSKWELGAKMFLNCLQNWKWVVVSREVQEKIFWFVCSIEFEMRRCRSITFTIARCHPLTNCIGSSSGNIFQTPSFILRRFSKSKKGFGTVSWWWWHIWPRILPEMYPFPYFAHQDYLTMFATYHGRDLKLCFVGTHFWFFSRIRGFIIVLDNTQ